MRLIHPSPPSPAAGTFLLSLDLELAWGVRATLPPSYLETHVRGVQRVVLALLDRFQARGIHATWAVVGFLCLPDREALLAHAPLERPTYADPAMDPYAELDGRPLDPVLHFAPNLVTRIAVTPGQELGTHTFSHFGCLEPGPTLRQFEADLTAAHTVAEGWGRPLESLVFPGNQYALPHLEAVARAGIRTFRGGERHPLYRASAHVQQGRLMRAGRLLDSVLNLTGHHTYRPRKPQGNLPLDLPSSRFLRPVAHPGSPLARLQRRRIEAAMTHAARTGEVFHLWWHPHNFGAHLAANLAHLDRILDHFAALQEAYGMRSLGMAELARAVSEAP